MTAVLPELPSRFTYRLELAKHVTPRLLKDEPVHRWFYFPHSFSPQLVELLFDHWQLSKDSTILDPFVGAGTTLRSAQQHGYNGIGIDLSPLSVFVSRVKTSHYDSSLIRHALEDVLSGINHTNVDVLRSERLKKAFTDKEFSVLSLLRQNIAEQSEHVKQFLLLGLLRVQQKISRAKPDGGWFRWVKRDCQASQIGLQFKQTIEWMLDDLTSLESMHQGFWEVFIGDARTIESFHEDLMRLSDGCQAIVTSPPYPNRHDYSRIFQIELLTLGLSESEIFNLRYNSLRSHVEARAPKQLTTFSKPTLLHRSIESLPDDADSRIEPMLMGYFEDMNAMLSL